MHQGECLEKDAASEDSSVRDLEEIGEEEEEEEDTTVVVETSWVDAKEKYPVLKTSTVEKAYSFWEKTSSKPDMDVALVLCELGMDERTVAAALMQHVSREECAEKPNLGPVVHSILDQVGCGTRVPVQAKN